MRWAVVSVAAVALWAVSAPGAHAATIALASVTSEPDLADEAAAADVLLRDTFARMDVTVVAPVQDADGLPGLPPAATWLVTPLLDRRANGWTFYVGVADAQGALVASHTSSAPRPVVHALIDDALGAIGTLLGRAVVPAHPLTVAQLRPFVLATRALAAPDEPAAVRHLAGIDPAVARRLPEVHDLGASLWGRTSLPWSARVELVAAMGTTADMRALATTAPAPEAAVLGGWADLVDGQVAAFRRAISRMPPDQHAAMQLVATLASARAGAPGRDVAVAAMPSFVLRWIMTRGGWRIDAAAQVALRRRVGLVDDVGLKSLVGWRLLEIDEQAGSGIVSAAALPAEAVPRLRRQLQGGPVEPWKQQLLAELALLEGDVTAASAAAATLTPAPADLAAQIAYASGQPAAARALAAAGMVHAAARAHLDDGMAADALAALGTAPSPMLRPLAELDRLVAAGEACATLQAQLRALRRRVGQPLPVAQRQAVIDAKCPPDVDGGTAATAAAPAPARSGEAGAIRLTPAAVAATGAPLLSTGMLVALAVGLATLVIGLGAALVRRRRAAPRVDGPPLAPPPASPARPSASGPIVAAPVGRVSASLPVVRPGRASMPAPVGGRLATLTVRVVSAADDVTTVYVVDCALSARLEGPGELRFQVPYGLRLVRGEVGDLAIERSANVVGPTHIVEMNLARERRLQEAGDVLFDTLDKQLEFETPAGAGLGLAPLPPPPLPPPLAADGKPAPIGPGRVLGGRYRIERRLGAGGFGTVFLAHDLNLDRAVAVKVLMASVAADGAQAAEIAAEARALARLSHGNIVAVFDHGRDGDQPYLVMEFVEAVTLEQAIRTRGRIEVRESLTITSQICAGLAYAHARGVLHRDIKPSNVLLGNDGTVKIVDFGIAKISQARVAAQTKMRGTPAYMAPEQVLGTGVSPQSDVYAIGGTLFTMVCGRPPFVDGILAFQQVHEPAPAAASINPDLPDVIDHLIGACLAKEAEARFGSAEALGRAVREALYALTPRD